MSLGRRSCPMCLSPRMAPLSSLRTFSVLSPFLSLLPFSPSPPSCRGSRFLPSFLPPTKQSQFSVEDATATISSGAISERTRKLKEEQETLRQKHATERQDTDLPLISAEMARMVRPRPSAYSFFFLFFPFFSFATAKRERVDDPAYDRTVRNPFRSCSFWRGFGCVCV